MHILIAEDAPDVAELVASIARRTWPNASVTTAGVGTHPPAPQPQIRLPSTASPLTRRPEPSWCMAGRLPATTPLPEDVRGSATPEARRQRGPAALHPDRVGCRLSLRGPLPAGVRGHVPARHVPSCGTSPATGRKERSMKRWT